ncbi:MAG: hypothetical protein VB135_02790, partial [Burkholderia sp.]
TGVLDWLLGINVNRSLARPIYATTPLNNRIRYRTMKEQAIHGRLFNNVEEVRAARRVERSFQTGWPQPGPIAMRRWPVSKLPCRRGAALQCQP